MCGTSPFLYNETVSSLSKKISITHAYLARFALRLCSWGCIKHLRHSEYLKAWVFIFWVGLPVRLFIGFWWLDSFPPGQGTWCRPRSGTRMTSGTGGQRSSSGNITVVNRCPCAWCGATCTRTTGIRGLWSKCLVRASHAIKLHGHPPATPAYPLCAAIKC